MDLGQPGGTRRDASPGIAVLRRGRGHHGHPEAPSLATATAACTCSGRAGLAGAITATCRMPGGKGLVTVGADMVGFMDFAWGEKGFENENQDRSRRSLRTT